MWGGVGVWLQSPGGPRRVRGRVEAASGHGFSSLPQNYHLPWLASAQLPDVGGPRVPKLCPSPFSIQGKYV